MMFRKEVEYDLLRGREVKYFIRCKYIEIEKVIKILEEELKK